MADPPIQPEVPPSDPPDDAPKPPPEQIVERGEIQGALVERIHFPVIL